MAMSPLAGKPAPKELLVDVAALVRAFDSRVPDLDDPAQRVTFGTSGHRGSSLAGSFTRGAHPRDHAGDLRLPERAAASTGPLFLGKDTHALSGPAQRTALEVLAAQRRRDDHPARRRLHADAGDLARDPRAQPRPRATALADGIVVTPSHNPPEDGGFKYNPPNGGPADTDVDDMDRGARQRAAARAATRGVKRVPLESALRAADDARAGSSCCPTSTICRTSSTWRRSAPPG